MPFLSCMTLMVPLSVQREDLVHAVDLEIIKARTHMPSQTTEIRDEFCTKLQEREGYCAWTQIKYGTGLHIIPHHLGSEVRSTIFRWKAL